MSTKHTFTQALAARPWYKPTIESQELLKELDKDLKKWNAHVNDDSTPEQVCCVAEATFDNVRYRFTLRISDALDVVPIDHLELPAPYRAILKTHLRARNVLKNFLPVVFDRLSAMRRFALVSMCSVPSQGMATHCIWATNEAGLGLSVVTMVMPEDSIVMPVQPAAKEEETQPMQMVQAITATTSAAAPALLQ